MKNNVKKIILTILIMLFAQMLTFGQVTTADTLKAVENNLFGYDYPTDTDTARLDRIETQLYGSKRTGDVKTRLNNIKNDMGISITDSSKMPQKPKNNNTGQINKLPEQPKREQPNLSVKEDSSVDYPIVDKMETIVFNTTYKKDNIYVRLDRLEEKVFSKKSNADLNTRVDRLASAISPGRNSNPMRQDTYNSDIAQNMDNLRNGDITFQMAALEQEILNSDYNNENIARRLSRLEQKLFGRTFLNDSDADRMQRIIAAYEAQKQNYSYEKNRRMQNAAAMSQIGGILLILLSILL